MVELSDKTIEVAYEILRFIEKRKHSPSVVEVAKAVGMQRSSVYPHLSRLSEVGIISWLAGEVRTLQVNKPDFVKGEHAARVKRIREDYIYG
ncbi:LexA family protein [Paenibacillus spongiae]|uniref:Helix-turn-helix domain-containing protein n=1 Tax=Paenibacillus spongiae TaxID=2909671 RepID=A0ABY5SDN6_9BACL|nr:helix-turn-helix domain-containing protein [Paenibacillus spongiae]UVI32077.1 helix-turn-helix domain-containing protein [Paenibacillus spongiae]